MAAARCSPCDLLLPSDKKVCPVCKEPTWKTKDEWDFDWRDQVKRLKKLHTFGNPIPTIDAPVLTKDGFSFIDVETPKEYGYHDLEAGSILKIRNRFYEVSGPVRYEGEQTGWMIELVPTTGLFKKMQVLTGREYKELEVQRGLRQ